MLLINLRNTMDITMDKIIDIHTHILPGVDDGARNIEESIKIIDYLYSKGITDMVLSSHYIKDTDYSFNQIARSQILENLRAMVTNPDIHLYLGNEVYLCEDLIDLLEKHEISTINGTRYMLIELPLTGVFNGLQNILCELTNYGIIPIIAHPERYAFLQEDNRRIRELLEFGCLLQCNVDSLVGKYGKKAKKLIKWFLKRNLVSFIASDTHYVDHDDMLTVSYKKLKRLVGDAKFKELTFTNPTKVLDNQIIKGNLEYLIKEEKRKK